MEDTLRAIPGSTNSYVGIVLILVLMEDTLRDDIKKLIKNYQFEVLILVLMEDTLRVDINIEQPTMGCLNPCFNGRYSQRIQNAVLYSLNSVLILVLMEDTLREQRLMFLCIRVFGVCSNF